jgi:hypothetical protein
VTNTVVDNLSEEMVVALARLCQDFQTQIDMYGDIPDLPDDLVLDFGCAIFRSSDDLLELNPDIANLDAFISEKSGILEYWTYEALEHSGFWEQIRCKARDCLVARGLPAIAPEINIGFINVDELFLRKQQLKGRQLWATFTNFFARQR